MPQQKYEENCLRTKPGRLDLPVNKRSLSLSCSDKVGLWNILGVQGRRLFSKVTPIYIDRVVLEVPAVHSASRIHQGIDLLRRISCLRGLEIATVHRKIFGIVINGKERTISKQFNPHNPIIHFLLKDSSAHEKTLELCGVISCGETSWLNGKTGLPEGVSINKNYHKISPFSSASMYGQWQDNPEEQFKYTAIKERVKLLFGEWTDHHKH